jgi:hypothetical protein
VVCSLGEILVQVPCLHEAKRIAFPSMMLDFVVDGDRSERWFEPPWVSLTDVSYVNFPIRYRCETQR